jgi:HD-GYP domain-containing protein (c-di-GMP phosphodiesterase class II)
MTSQKQLESHLSQLIDVGLSLSAEKDNALLLEKIMLAAKEIANADGGTIYTMKGDKYLQMDIVRNDSLHIAMGGSSKQPATFAPLPLYLDNGEPNYANVVTCAIHDDAVIDIKDRHEDNQFDFSGAQKFDDSTGYNSVSFLTIPMKDHKGKMIGALQLINALDHHGNTIPFTYQNALLVKSLASQAAVALTNKHLIDELEQLFESFIELIAGAIDEKSPYTGGHCRRVPELTIMINEALDANTKGPLKDFKMSENDRYELKIASWLHDCGKIATPEYVIDKATKLETIYDRINEVNTRFEVVRRDIKIKQLEAELEALRAGKELSEVEKAEFAIQIKQTVDDQAFIKRHNIGGEFMSEEDQQRVEDIAHRYQITDITNLPSNILSTDEIMNMQISRGTLNHEERQIINKHISVTIDMLNNLKLPDHLKNVPEIAGGHHERMDGNGYPRGLTREQMSIQTRAMGIADVFEALTAADRPYKKAKTLSESLGIMKRMRDNHHLDPDIFEVFVRDKVYLDYAKKFLKDYQIDEIDEQDLLG